MFDQFLGRNQAEIIDDPLTKKGVEFWLNRVDSFYGTDNPGVDIEIIDQQIILNQKTTDYIYSEFTPDTLKYVPGSRPLLEKTLSEAGVKSTMSQKEKARAIMIRCRDNRDCGLASPGLFYGGSEEDILRRGGIMCNEISRVFTCLCQIAGLPARLFCSHISGHMMSEVKIDGRWQWVDSMKGMMPVKDDDSPASAWDLVNDPAILDRQPDSVLNDCRPVTTHFTYNKERQIAFSFARAKDCYFHPREATAIGNYFVWDYMRYTYPWRLNTANPQLRETSYINETLNRKALSWPDYYFEPCLFDGKLKKREAR